MKTMTKANETATGGKSFESDLQWHLFNLTCLRVESLEWGSNTRFHLPDPLTGFNQILICLCTFSIGT